MNAVVLTCPSVAEATELYWLGFGRILDSQTAWFYFFNCVGVA